MKKFTRPLILSLVLLVILSSLPVLGGCDTTPTGDTTTAAQTQTPVTTDGSSAGFTVVRDGAAVCTIVRPDLTSDDVKDAASLIRTKIGEYTGVKPDIITDYIKDGGNPDPDAPEILFGLTNRPESAAACEAIKTYGSYSISVVGKKLVIAAADPMGYSRAASRLSYLLDEEAGRDTLALPAGTGEADFADEMLGTLPIYNDEKSKLESFYDCGDGALMYILRNTSLDAWKAYCTLLAGNGYTLYAENAIGNNSYATYNNDKYTVNTFFLANEKRTRIIIEPISGTALAPLDGGDYKITGKTSVTQMGLEYIYGTATIGYQIGMCYLIKLADGSFIVIDGGGGQTGNVDRIIYNLQKLADDRADIRVAAWILTHGHTDHTGALRLLAQTKQAAIKIETFMLNFASQSVYDSLNESPFNVYTAFKSYPDAKVIKVHPGQKFHIRNAVIEIYYTHEMLAPTSCDTGNTLSLVFSLTAEGQKIMFLGDESELASGKIVQTYGASLKSDIVQVSHHGAPGGTVALYKLIDPKVALWPLGEWDYWYFNGYGRRNESWNAYLFSSPNIEEIILAGKSVVTLTLPYKTTGNIPIFPEKTADTPKQ